MCLTCSQNNEDACMTGEDLNAGASSGRWDYKGNWMTGSNRVLYAISRILALIQVNKKKFATFWTDPICFKILLKNIL